MIIKQFELTSKKTKYNNVSTEWEKENCVSLHWHHILIHVKPVRGLFQTLASGTAAYQPWWISTAFFLLASRDLRFAPVFLCSVPTFTALSITEYASPIIFSIDRISSACASGFFLSSSRASKTYRPLIRRRLKSLPANS